MRLLVVTGMLVTLLFSEQLRVDQGNFSGQLVGFEGGKVLFETGFSQMLRVDPATVIELEGSRQMHLRTQNDLIYTGVPTLGREGVSIGGEQIAYGDIYRMQPLEKLKKLRQEGYVDLGFHEVRGNTRSTSSSVDAGTTLRQDIHRHTLRASLSKQKSEGETIEDRQSYRYQYDRFVGVRWYLYGTLAYSSDEAIELRSRQEAGLGAGHQFIDSDTTAVSLSLGANRVWERYYSVSTQSDTAALLAMSFAHRVLEGRIALFHENETLFFPDRDDDYRLVARTGMRVGMAEGLTASVQHRDEIRRHVPAGTKDHDRALTVALGYRW